MLYPIDLQEELRYRLALTKIPQIGVVLARSLLEKFGTAKAIFEAKRSHLEHTEGMGKVRTEQIKNFREFTQIEKEMCFMEKYRIRALCHMDEAYPKRLLHCYDPPTILFCKGNADLNAEKFIGVVGTRNNTEYGRSMAEAIVHSLSEWNVTIVSGMAFGIDAVAHKACLRHQLTTVGVLAHGLAHMYPGEHKKMAGDIIASAGAMVTEYWSSEEPDKHLFPARNRIVAGMCDALVVIESGLKGGSMLTAELASGYNRDIYAFPGRANDPQSEGCNHLIKTNKAQLLSNPEELADHLGWKRQPAEKQGMQYTLPLSLNAHEKKVLAQFTSQHTMHIEQLNAGCDVPMHSLSAILVGLEIQGLIRSLPGKLYKRI